MSTVKKYDEEYKKEAVKLAEKVGNKAAAEQLGIPTGTVGTWVRSSRMAAVAETSKEESEEHGVLYELRKQLKEKEKEIKRLKEENEILEEAAAFFAASRRRSGKTSE